MDDKEADDGVYDYYCMDCNAIVNPQDKVCPHCGADLSEFVEVNEEGEETPPEKCLPVCPLCGSGSFRREEWRPDSALGFSTEVMRLLICERCQYVLQFYGGDSIWDLD